MTQRNPTFDIMKGVGMVAIVSCHLTSSLNGLFFSFHIPLFFILAGFFFKEEPFTVLLKKSASRLLVPYIITCLAIFIIDLTISVLLHKPFSPYWIIASLYGSGSTGHTSALFSDAPSIGAIWFLLALFWCRLLFHVINKICPSKLYLLIICLCLSLFATYLDRVLINLPFAILPATSALIFYCIGHIAKSISMDAVPNKALLAAMVLCWVIVIILSHLSEIRLSVVRCFYKCYPLDVASAIGGTYLIYLLSSFLKRVSYIASPLSWIGRNSILFLCVHTVDLDLSLRQIIHINSGIIAILFTLVVCAIATIIFGKIPFFQKVFRISNFEIST